MNCEVGDLAYVVFSDIPENIGLIVKVLAFAGITSYEIGNYPSWLVEIPENAHGFDDDNNIVQTKHSCGIVADLALRRIAGPSINIGVDTERPINNEVIA